MQVHVSVTQEHIDKGERNCHGKCALALAILDAFNVPGLYVSVIDPMYSACKVSLRNGKTGPIIGVCTLSPELIEFTSKFDRGEPVGPFDVFMDFQPPV